MHFKRALIAIGGGGGGGSACLRRLLSVVSKRVL